MRHLEHAVEYATRSTTHHAWEGPKHEILHHYELAPPFWPLTRTRAQPAPAGYGVNRDGACIRYARKTLRPNGYSNGFTVERTEFGPGCRELMRRADGNAPVFVCEMLAPRDAIRVIGNYLIDALISLTEGRGPLVVDEDGNSENPGRVFHPQKP